MNTRLREIRESVFKGKAGLEEEQLQNLIVQMNELFIDKEQYSFLLNDSNILILIEILKSIPTAQLSEIILYELDVKTQFKICEFIIKKNNDSKEIRLLIHELLNLYRYSTWMQKISGSKDWENLFAELIEFSNYNYNVLFKQRVRDYSNKTLFKVIKGDRYEEYSWEKVDKYVQKYSKSLYAIVQDYERVDMDVAFLLENSLDMAILDIASLSTGIRNIMIPANSVSAHITFILNQTKTPVVIASNEKQLSKIKSVKNELAYLKKVVLLSGKSIEDWVIPFNEFLENGLQTLPDVDIQINDLTSLMYTSGTTGDPKGIMFSQMNIVYKRFMRAMALPKISDRDRYLAFLPLFHTFGRYLELSGAVFWGAEYCFMENP